MLATICHSPSKLQVSDARTYKYTLLSAFLTVTCINYRTKCTLESQLAPVLNGFAHIHRIGNQLYTSLGTRSKLPSTHIHRTRATWASQHCRHTNQPTTQTLQKVVALPGRTHPRILYRHSSGKFENSHTWLGRLSTFLVRSWVDTWPEMHQPNHRVRITSLLFAGIQTVRSCVPSLKNKKWGLLKMVGRQRQYREFW